MRCTTNFSQKSAKRWWPLQRMLQKWWTMTGRSSRVGQESVSHKLCEHEPENASIPNFWFQLQDRSLAVGCWLEQARNQTKEDSSQAIERGVGEQFSVSVWHPFSRCWCCSLSWISEQNAVSVSVGQVNASMGWCFVCRKFAVIYRLLTDNDCCIILSVLESSEKALAFSKCKIKFFCWNAFLHVHYSEIRQRMKKRQNRAWYIPQKLSDPIEREKQMDKLSLPKVLPHMPGKPRWVSSVISRLTQERNHKVDIGISTISKVQKVQKSLQKK